MPTTLSIKLNEMQRLDVVSDKDALGNASTFYQDYIDTLKEIADLNKSGDMDAGEKIQTAENSLSGKWSSFTEALEGAFNSDVWEQEGSEMTEYLKGKAEDIANG